MTDSPPISLVCLDLASIVIDGSIVERAFAEAIATQGIVAGTQDYARAMVRFDRSHGRARAAVLRDLFDDDEPRAQAALLAFERSFVRRPSGSELTFRSTSRTRWARRQVRCQDLPAHDAVTAIVRRAPRTTARGGPGRLWRRRAARFPWPDPVLTAMLKLGAADVREVAVVSASPDGVLSGYRAGARILVGLGSGHRAAALFEAGATHVIDSITTIPDLVAEVSSAN